MHSTRTCRTQEAAGIDCGMINTFIFLLPWIVIVFVILGFSLADDLPAPVVGRTFLTAGVALVALTAVALWFSPDVAAPGDLLVAAGAPAFLVVHRVLRAVFRRWKGDEPVLAGAGAPGAARFFYEVEQPRRLGWRDYVYTFFLGIGMLLAALPAMERLVDQ